MPAERERLQENTERKQYWTRWGPYLAERSWGNPREDYSADGRAWDYFPHDHARSRTYRWTEDGIAGICDNHQRLCFAFAFWNEKDAILKERYFGLDGNQGNHGEDVKEYFYYLDSTPTHSYMKCLYKYPQREYPYTQILQTNSERTKADPEFELIDTGVFTENRYFDICVEYAKNGVDDLLIRLRATNRGPDTAKLHVLPTLWFRNTWSWGYGTPRPTLHATGRQTIHAEEATLGNFDLYVDTPTDLLFTENETNTERLWNYKSGSGHYKDAFHEYVIHGRKDAVNGAETGTKAAAWYQLELAAGETHELTFRLCASGSPASPGSDSVFKTRIDEADEFYSFAPDDLSGDARNVQRQALAGLLWSKQFYNYVVETWLKGDPAFPPPPPERKKGRNHDWIHLYNEDVLSIPDKWEYPWYAAWDLAFHMIPFSLVDPEFAKQQLGLFLREWYMGPNGQIPAYEWQFSDANPPVHAWACWRVFKIDAKANGKPDYAFLESAFHKLLMNFTWWVNRKDSQGNNIFEGGFLGLDNVGIFDRSRPLPTGGFMEQADGTAWMGLYCLVMMKIAMELTWHDQVYEDIASKFFEHFLYIANAINCEGGAGLWDEEDGFYYDRIQLPNGNKVRIQARSMVGLIPMFAVTTIEQGMLDRLPGFRKRLDWFVEHRKDLQANLASMTRPGVESRRILALLNRDRLLRVLSRMLDENEFLSPYGIRSMSRYHLDHPFELQVNGDKYSVDYEPAESTSGVFGGNSNWRGPIWFPVNFLLIETLQRYHHFWGDEVKVDFPTGSGNKMTLGEVATEISHRLAKIFLKDETGRRPVFGGVEQFQSDPNFHDHLQFYEYFNGDNGAGLGASHQTGWTALVAKLLQQSKD